MIEEFKDKIVTPLDLCRFSSLRIATITCSFLSFVTYAMYYGPALIIDEVGFNIFVSSFMIQLSELVSYIPAYAFIEKMKRKKLGIILFSIASFVSFILVFLERPEDC
jgi:branched-subunit amino acid transport protein